jgi:hypothetical protein
MRKSPSRNEIVDGRSAAPFRCAEHSGTLNRSAASLARGSPSSAESRRRSGMRSVRANPNTVLNSLGGTSAPALSSAAVSMASSSVVTSSCTRPRFVVGLMRQSSQMH